MKNLLTVGLEVKAVGDNEFEGHGSVFGNVDLGGDIVVPGAFKRSLAQHKKSGTLPQMFWMHDPAQVPGKWTDMGEDSKGLYVKGVFAPTQLGQEVKTLLNMKAVRGLSIGYMTKDSDFDDDGNRLIKEVDLWEVSVVSLAMNPAAQVEAMKARLSATGEYVPTKRQFEKSLRDLGYSKSFAVKAASVICSDHADLRDADVDDDAELFEMVEQLKARQIADTLRISVFG
jgi:uncharacterized protein